MGITFGDDAEVHVEGDMTGGDKVVIARSSWDAVAAAIAEGGGADLAQRADATQALSALRLEMQADEPSPTVIERFAGTIKRLAPHAFTVLLSVAPEIVKIVPALAQ